MVSASELEQSWRLAESRAPRDADAVTADPLAAEVAGRRVFTGVDSAGVRHLLLPLDGRREHARVTQGTAVRLATRSLLLEGSEADYADVSCSRPDLYDEFAVLAAEILAELDGAAADPVDTAAEVITRWRDLLRAISVPVLDRSAVIGLFAELLVLERVVAADARRRTDCWTGPRRGRHDFQRGNVVLDVKGSTARRGRPIVIHGLDQLESPPGADLYLWWIQLEIGVGRGRSLRMLVDQLRDRITDVSTFDQELRRGGYDFDNQEDYEAPLLTELDARLYLVDDSFPRLLRRDLVGGDLPARVAAVSYEVDLSGDQPVPLDDERVRQVTERLGGA